MRKVVILAVTAVLAMSLLPTVDASARTSGQHLSLPPLTPVEADALSAALDSGRLNHAEYALHRARSLFGLRGVRNEFGAVARPDYHEATFILRDLALRLNKLSGAERDAAEALLARPTQGNNDPIGNGYTTAEGTPVCTANACIHYVSTTSDQASPAFLTAASTGTEEVWAAEVDTFGYRKPKADGAASHNGGNALFDVYLKDLGAGFYGYCTTDPGQSTYTQYAYCVVDNDFASSQFPGPVSGVNALNVTLAHEFFHAIQFGYDVAEDVWIMEASATAMEDEVYDAINDNYNYLTASPMARPQTPADTFKDYSNPSDADSGFQYGTFTWMRYLIEKFGTRDVIKEIWNHLDASTTGANSDYSLEGISAMLAARGSNFASSFVDFAARNTDPSLFYEEGAAYEAKIGTPPRQSNNTIAGGGAPVSGSVSDADHLSSEFISLKPGSGVGSTEQISIGVNLGTAPNQKAAVVNIANGAMTVQEITLTNGEGNITVAFGGQSEVVLVLSNASTRMGSCGSGNFSCSGNSLDDNQKYTWAAALGATAPDPGDPGNDPDPDPDPGDEAPVISNVTASPSTLRANGSRSTRIQFEINENASVKVQIVSNKTGSKVFSFTAAISQGPGAYFFNWRGQNNKGKLVPAGKYKVKLTPTDGEGNRGATKSVTITVKR